MVIVMTMEQKAYHTDDPMILITMMKSDVYRVANEDKNETGSDEMWPDTKVNVIVVPFCPFVIRLWLWFLLNWSYSLILLPLLSFSIDFSIHSLIHSLTVTDKHAVGTALHTTTATDTFIEVSI